jgi:hypothetical protein
MIFKEFLTLLNDILLLSLETYSTEFVCFLIVPENNSVIPLSTTFNLRIRNQQGGANMGISYVWDSTNNQIGNTLFVPFNSVIDTT